MFLPDLLQPLEIFRGGHKKISSSAICERVKRIGFGVKGTV